jgi:RNA polymerase sigma-70 factor (ECF subfamily)
MADAEPLSELRLFAEVRKAGAAGREAFRVLCDDLWPVLSMAAVRRLGAGSDDAFEAVQRTLLAIWTKRDQFHLDRGLRPVAFGILELECLQILRGRKERVQELTEIDEPTDPSAGPMTTARRRDRDAMVEAAVEGLPQAHRQVIRMRYFDDLSYLEIGRRLGLSVSTVCEHCHRALERLRPILCGAQPIA